MKHIKLFEGFDTKGKWYPVDAEKPELISKLDKAYTDKYVWHVAPTKKRDDILSNGLVPENYTEDFIRYENVVCAWATNKESDILDFKKNMDIWQIDLSKIKGTKWYEDPYTSNDWGVCTDKAIPADALELYYDGKTKKYTEDK